MATKQATSKAPAQVNGDGPSPEQKALTEAIAYEEAIRAEADEIWGENTALTEQLFRKLYPLLRRPIPQGYIEKVGVVTGKPYESTGVRSVQVQIDRLNAVLSPLCWHYAGEYEQNGRLCKVTVTAEVEGNPRSFSSYGGVKQGSSEGNIYKGSFTNAAKLAIARLGPGWEVYVGAADFDPDTDQTAAEAQAQAGSDVPPVDTIDSEAVAELVSAYEAAKAKSNDAGQFVKDLKLELGAMAVPTPSLNKAFASLTPAQHDDVKRWLGERS